MPQSIFDEIVEMNVAHPFREGNGRSMRIWLDAMFRKGFGVVVDWNLVDKEDYLAVMERSPVRDVEIGSALFRKTVSWLRAGYTRVNFFAGY